MTLASVGKGNQKNWVPRVVGFAALSREGFQKLSRSPGCNFPKGPLALDAEDKDLCMQMTANGLQVSQPRGRGA